LRIGSRFEVSVFKMLSRFICCLIIWDVSFAESEVWLRNLYPFGVADVSNVSSKISLAIVSFSRSPSRVKFESSVFALFRGSGE